MFDLKNIYNSLKKLFNRRDYLILFLLIAAFFLTRLINLDRFPIFSDEGIYIRWAKTAWRDASWRFISLTDGRQPLQTWCTIPLLKLFPNNALLAGRLFATITGFVSFGGIFILLCYLFDKKTAFIGLFLYIFTPFFLFYDRIAMVDSGVNAAFIWILLFSILLVKTLRLDVALLFGLTAGLFLLAKSSVRLFLFFSILAPILIVNKNKKDNIRKLVNFLFLFTVVVSMSYAIYNIQRLSPFFHFVNEKNKAFVLTLDEFLKAPLLVFFVNLKDIPIYIFWEMGFLTVLIAILGLFKLYKNNRSLFFYIIFWFFASYLSVALFMKTIFPRYIIFLVGILLLCASFALRQMKKRNLIILLIAIFFINLYFNYSLIFNFKNSPFPPVDRGQYIEGWTAGWGMKEIVDYVRLRSQEKPALILAEGNFGMAGDVLEVFLRPNDKINIKGYWPLMEKDLLENMKELDSKSVFAVYGHKPKGFTSEFLKLIQQYDKPGQQNVIYLFELIK